MGGKVMDNMKRKLSVLLAGMLLAQSAGIMTVNAEGMTGVYADIYGVSVSLDFKASEEEIALYLGEESVDADIKLEGENVLITPKDGYLKTDKVYKLVVGEAEKEFKIKTLFSENFDEMQNGVVTGKVSNDYGDMDFSEGANGNAFYQDNKLALADANMIVSNFEEAEGEKITFSADVEGYGKKGYKADGVSTYTANAGYVTVYMGIDNYATELKNRSFKGGAFADGVYTATTESENDYPNINAITDNRFGFSKVTDGDVSLTSYGFDTASETRSIAIRKTEDELLALSNGVELFSFGDGDVDADEMSFTADYRTLLVLDNILVTCYTEDVAEPEKGEVKATGIEGDFDALYLTFDRTLKGTSDFSKIHVYENDVEVKRDITFSNDELTELKIVPERYCSGNTYKVFVEKDFGTKHMWTYEEYEFEKYLEPIYIGVKEAVMNASGITISFEEAIPSGADKSQIKVYKNDEECGATIQIIEDKIIIVPEDYELNNTYKAVVPAGFGNKNIYLESEYSFEDEYLKAEIEIEKLSGNSGFVYITMNEDVSEITDWSFVKLYKDDEVVGTTIKVSENVVTVSASEDFATDDVYEIYVGTFETDEAVMKKAYRKQFAMKEVIFEDFEDNEMAEGVIANGKTIVDGKKASGVSEEDADKNKRRIMWNDTITITNSEVVNAENYDITFDYQLFNANLNNSDKNYTASVPFTNWYYNKKGSTEGYKIYMNPTATRNQIYSAKEGTWKDFSRKDHTEFLDGDAYYDREAGIYYIYDLGDTLPFEKNARTVSERSIPEAKKIKIVKNGKNIYAWYGEEQFVLSEPGDEQPEYLTGEFMFQNQVTEIGMYDNISIRKFEVLDFEEVSASSVEVGSETDGVLSGTFRIGNYSDEDKPLKAAVCAYGENNLMQAMEIIDISEIEAGEKELVEFSVDKVENVEKITIYLWKDTENFEQYGNFELSIN